MDDQNNRIENSGTQMSKSKHMNQKWFHKNAISNTSQRQQSKLHSQVNDINFKIKGLLSV